MNMCIIAAKPMGIKMPTDNIIENMWYGNSDGAGFMWAEKGSVHIRKGFMTFDEFKAALDKFTQTHDATKLPVVMHFRITTHGGTKPENCHPFPISDSVAMLTRSECKGRVGVAHNGIIPITPRKDISDTMEYIISQLSPLSRAVPEFYRNKDLLEMIRNATGSRLAFLNGKGEIFTVGDFIEDNGIKYSNSSFKYNNKHYFASSYSYGYGWSDAWDDDYNTGVSQYGMTGWSEGDPNALAKARKNGTFVSKEVMWLDENFGYITGVTDYDPDGCYALDLYNNLYVYDWDIDALVKMDGATAWSNTGTMLRFDRKSKDTMREITWVKFYTYNGGKSKQSEK